MTFDCVRIPQREIGVTIEVGKQNQEVAVKCMGHTTWFPDEFRDLIIGIVAIALALLIWAAVLTPSVICRLT